MVNPSQIVIEISSAERTRLEAVARSKGYESAEAYVRALIELDTADQAWFWTEEWQAKEHEADEDLAVGRYKDFDTMDDFLAGLKKFQSNSC
jgi:hypothetical protein